MSTPLTITRLVRWRVRDWASCFYACRFPVDEEPERFCCSTIKICNNRGQERDDKNEMELSEERYKREQKSTEKLKESSSGDLEEKGNENEDEESRWPSFEEEDYIVFCFEEDGAIHMVKEMKSEPSIRIDRSNSTTSSRPINRKLIYGENGKKVNSSKHVAVSKEEEKDIYPTNEESECISSRKKGKKKAINHLNTKSLRDNTNEVNKVEVTKECKDVSAVSSDDSSGQSDSSTSSFAFPVVSWEWMGSPVKMPKSEHHLHFSKHKPESFCLHCCRFLKPC